jgi:hypothetical protein
LKFLKILLFIFPIKGSLLAYPGNDINALGKIMGTYYDGNPIYIGTGNFAQNPGPARISTFNTFRGPGAYR